MNNTSNSTHYTIYNRILNIYLCAFIIIIPLIITNGYINIVETKYIAFIILSFAMFISLIIAIFFDKSDSLDNIISLKSFKPTDIAVSIWYLSVTISTIFSINHKIAISGEAGWYTGWTLYTIIFIVYICTRLFARISNQLIICLCISNIISSILGILDVFGVHIIPIYERNSNYLSTLGNVDWICGYLSIIIPLLLGLTIYIYDSRHRIITIISLTTTLIFAIIQPAQSVYIPLFITFFLYCLTIMKKKRHYNTANLLVIGTVVLLLLSIILMFACLISAEINEKLISLTTFSSEWGNGRGAAMLLATSSLKTFNIRHLMFGVGPDCFLSYIQTHETLYHHMIDHFTVPLTNAHMEPLTLQVNTGILGSLAYYIMLLSPYICNKKEDASSDSSSRIIRTIICITIISFAMHNLVSFQQILNLPLVIILLGLYQAKIN